MTDLRSWKNVRVFGCSGVRRTGKNGRPPGSAEAEFGGRGSEANLNGLTCREVILEYLSDYLDASLSPDIVEELERHLAACKPCAAYLNTYRRTRELTGRAAPTAMPEEMKAHLRQFLLELVAKG